MSKNLAFLTAFLLGANGLWAQTFSYTGAVQTYTVPACVNNLTVDVRGASGSAQGLNFSLPGLGGRVQATIPVTPGEVLQIYVGGSPGQALAGWNGGGKGAEQAGGGGGASDIRQGGAALSNRIIVAAGGGGGGADGGHVYNNRGGNGGGLQGATGFTNSNQTNTHGGRGGTQSAGGVGGTGGTCGEIGQNGALGKGGDADTDLGGGGGGGYYGGGGGACYLGVGSAVGGGGGGGSSFAYAQATGVTHTSGYQSGNGQIIITAGAPGTPSVKSITGPDSLCVGDTVVFSCDTVASADSYTWTVPPGMELFEGQGSTVIRVVVGDTSGNIKVKTEGPCGPGAEKSKSILVFEKPTAGFGAPDQALVNTPVQFSDSSVGAFFYKWNFGDDSTSTEPNPQHTYAKTGQYLVRLVVNNGVCRDTSYRLIDIVETMAMARKNKPMVRAYPQPASGYLMIQQTGSGAQVLEFKVLDFSGRSMLISGLKWSSGLYRLDLEPIPAGVYTLSIVDELGMHFLPIMIE